MYENLALYYFTGTGNTRQVGRWLETTASTKGIMSLTAPLNKANPAADLAGENPLLGILSPTHGFTAPWWTIWFALKLPRGNGRHAFVLFTRAGMKIKNTFLPGLEGTGAYLIALILWFKGYRVRGVSAVDMPSNWTVIHPGYSEATSRAIMARSRPRAEAFLRQILSGRTALRGWASLLLGLALLPVSLAYVLMGRFFLAKMFYASGACSGCGACVKSCPVGGVRMVGKTNPRPYWTYTCESCTRCYNLCPNRAVEASYPFAVIAYYAANVPLAALLLDTLARESVAWAGLKETWVEWVVQYPFKLLILAGVYFFFHHLLRIPALNRLLTTATPAHYFRRYHPPRPTGEE